MQTVSDCVTMVPAAGFSGLVEFLGVLQTVELVCHVATGSVEETTRRRDKTVT